MPLVESTDEQLYGCWHGDGASAERQAAWEELERLYAQKLCGFFYVRLLNQDASADCARETFLRLMNVARPIRSVRAYLWKVAYSVLCEARRERERDASARALALGAPSSSDPSPGPADSAELAELHEALTKCLDALPHDHRDFVLMHVCSDLTLAEAAEAVGWSVAIPTSKYRFDKDLQNLAACLKKNGFSF